MIKSTYQKIFNSTDMFCDFFVDKSFIKKVLYPVPQYKLTEHQYNALRKTLEVLKLSPIVYEIVTENGNEIIKHDFSMQSYSDYCSKTNSLFENQLFSESLSWGIGISHEDHAFLGCSVDFYNIFQNFYGKNDKDDFIKSWNKNLQLFHSDIRWMDAIKNDLV